jgi:DNA polymerase-3 subunit alpha
MCQFSHLHSHTQYSLLDGAANVKKLFKKAAADGHSALAITDHGNMFGVFQFVAEAWKNTRPTGRKNEKGEDILEPVVKPIVGCEFYLVGDRHKKQFSRGEKDQRYHQLLLAKNAEGYKNLIQLCSLGFIEGFYSKYPRIDKELILKYHKGLIATTCCLAAEIPRAILQKGEEEAEKLFKWWLDLFGEDYYVELQRHGIGDQEIVNNVLLKFATKYGVKIIATNDSHYVDQEDANAHDILLCINTGEKQSTPISKDFSDDEVKPKGTRFGFNNQEFYFKTKEEMGLIFKDLPQALENTQEIVDKVETLNLKRDIILPTFTVPPGFSDQDEYLTDLAYKGAQKRYGEITPEVKERLDFELFTIRTMGFAGYFLIVQDFINKGKEIGVFVGPGRGSAAGSVVAYCIGITNIDPIKYNLLFERFLNPDRKSMPDIDTDFEDEGRQKVIDYVVEKYGYNQVAHIITYGTMAAKMSIKDVARVLDLPLQESLMLTKLVPDRPGVELDRLLNKPLDAEDGPVKKYNLGPDEKADLEKLRNIFNGSDLRAKVLKEALKLEGSVRNTGIHAAGIIIAPKDLKEIIPVATAKDVKLLVTQYEGNTIEDAGVIKMDFLGLKTLSILKDALELIRKNRGIHIDLDNIPLDDAKTFELYQKANTNGTFQFESAGMQKYLKALKPDKFDDLVAMNALYRPGPMEYIPNYINRKHGKEKITYDLPEMEEYLKETYGITVYQEQVMLLSQKLAGFTKGDADVLRKAMGKKDRKTLDKLKPKFIEQASAKGHDAALLEKIWKDWEAFAAYAFNKSHSVCYALVAYQTAYLKANYPAEYMAAVLSNNYKNADKISFFMSECRRMGLTVLGPDINESNLKFSVNKKGEIRFTLSALKGLGEAAAQAIIEEREARGPYKSIYDMVKRVNLRAVNKKSFETLAQAGAFDSFGEIHRAQYLQVLKDGSTALDRVIRFGNLYQQRKEMAANSLFGDSIEDQLVVDPEIPPAPVWNDLEKLLKEKETIGMYLSGHPLDEYAWELEFFCNCTLADMHEFPETPLLIGVMITEAIEKISSNNKPYTVLKVEDQTGEYEIRLYGEDHTRFAAYAKTNNRIRLSGVMRARYNNPDELEFKVKEMDYLQDLFEKEAKFLHIAFPAQWIDDETVEKLFQLAKLHKGNRPLVINILTSQDRVPLQLRSKSYRIQPNKQLLDEVKQMKALSFNIRTEESRYRKLVRKKEVTTEDLEVLETED